MGELVKSVKSIHVSVPADAWKQFETNYSFDTMGRMATIKFNDGETITYTYDSGGLLESVSSSTQIFKYVKNIDYNEFGQRTKVEYGNGAVSSYSYDPAMRRLTNLSTQSGGKAVQNISYNYDNVGNIKKRTNSNFKTSGEFAGSATQTYDYNDLHWLESSTGEYEMESGVNSYTNTFNYDTIGNILTKVQTNLYDSTSGSEVTLPDTTYNFNYTYGSSKPHAVTTTGDRSYLYDSNGNMTSWASGSDPSIWMSLTWDDENRLIKTLDAVNLTEYKYDADGKRIIKKGNTGEVVYFNTNYSVRNNDVKSKHVFAGNTRVVTKMKAASSDESIYFYHGDHLGSSSVITNKTGNFHENLEYFPYGETWVHEKVTGGDSLPYKFTSKELDEETGLYYFGARYYDVKLSRWVNVDPSLSDYLDSEKGLGGIYNSVNLDMYHYSNNNPIVLTDPNGEAVYIGGHSAFNEFVANRFKPPAYHLSIIMIPDNPQDFMYKGKQLSGWIQLKNGKLISSVGGQGMGNATTNNILGNLRGVRNFEGDFKVTFMQRVKTPEGMNDTQFINRIIRAANSYYDNLNYDSLPKKGTNGYNSNSYVSGIFKGIGIMPPVLNTGGKFQAPGYDKPIPGLDGGSYYFDTGNKSFFDFSGGYNNNGFEFNFGWGFNY